MEFLSKNTQIEKQKTGCLIVTIGKKLSLSKAASALDKAGKGALKKILQQGDLKVDAGSTLLLSHYPNIQADRVLLVRAGDELDSSGYVNMVTSAFNVLTNTEAKNATSYLEEAIVTDRDLFWKSLQTAYACFTASYRFNDYRAKKQKIALVKLTTHGANKQDVETIAGALDFASAVTKGMHLVKDLGNMPSNDCTPAYLAKTAKSLATKYAKVKTTVLDYPQLKKMKMGGIVGVGQGSDNTPKLISIEYKGGNAKDKPFVFVGKGVTFDSGGISIKPGSGMEEMKYDMCGAATVIGLIKACCEYELPINIVSVVPTVENMPSAKAYKPGDILTSYSGKTIEVINTDAEGRLILCDALSYCEKFKPEVVINMATLTGAAIVALGHEATALMGNDQALVDDLLDASRESHDPAWQLPLWDSYKHYLKSDCADVANCGNYRAAGTITAGIFLSYFTEQYRWAHLDIAGSAWATKSGKMASARPLPLLMEYLLSRCED